MGRALCRQPVGVRVLSEEALMGELPTAKDYSGVHTVHAVCLDPACDHWQELCSLCGRTGHEINQRQVLRIGRLTNEGIAGPPYTLGSDLRLCAYSVQSRKRPAMEKGSKAF